MKILWAILLALGVISAPLSARGDEFEKQLATAKVMAQEFKIPSPQPSGYAPNDTIYFSYYPPQGVQGRAPGLILLHFLGVKNNADLKNAAQYAAARGIAALVMTLPYHIERQVPHISPYDRFDSNTISDIKQSFSQSVADVRAVTDWLTARPEVDPQKLGILGASLGAIITHLAMGQDNRLRAGVAFEGGGDLQKIRQRNFLGSLLLRRKHKPLTPAQIEELKSVDPMTYANNNRPRRVLMVQAARDAVIPPQAGEALWEALGQPPIQWIDTNHIALKLAGTSSIRAAYWFLQAAWRGDEEAIRKTPKIHVPTLKFGWITGLDSRLTPAVQYQALTLGQRNHMALLGANLGLSGRGPFVGLAATATPFIDLGFAYRLNGGQGLKPYASFHVVF